MKRPTAIFKLPFALLALAHLAIPAPAADIAELIDPAWAADARWDDGRAEMALYDARQVIYGKPRAFRAMLITVKEPVNTDLMIKADDPAKSPRAVDALKLNVALDIPTPNYPYNFLACVQMRRDDPATLLRQTVGSQEWCGNTWKEFNTAGGRDVFVWRSYWEKEGNGEREVRLDAGHLTEEQLFTLLRALRPKPGLEFEARVYPSQFVNRAPAPEADLMNFGMTTGANHTIDSESGGREIGTWRIEATSRTGRRLTWEIGREAPRPLVSFRASDGREMTLRSIGRRAYWELKER